MSNADIYRKYETYGDQELEISLYYDLGGMNYFTYKEEPRGYYLSISPVEVERTEDGRIQSVTSIFGQGYKKLLVEVKRKSKKKEEEALKMLEECKDELIKKVLADFC